MCSVSPRKARGKRETSNSIYILKARGGLDKVLGVVDQKMTAVNSIYEATDSQWSYWKSIQSIRNIKKSKDIILEHLWWSLKNYSSFIFWFVSLCN